MNASRICAVPFLAPSNSPGELVLDPKLGRRALYQSQFSGVEGRPPALVRTDFERHEYASFAQPDGRGSWRVRVLSDNKIWFGLNGPGRLACFDPVAERYEDIPPYEPTQKTSHLTDVVEGPDGCLYMPAFPSGMLVSFDRDTGAYREYPVAEKNHQLYAACVTDSGQIGILNGLQHGVYTVDPQTGEVVHRSPPHLAGRPGAYSHFLCCSDEFLLTIAHPEGVEICRFSARDLTFLGSFVVTPPVAAGCNLMLNPNGQPFLSVDDGYICALNLKAETAGPAHRIPRIPSRGIYYFLDQDRILFAGHSQYYGIYDTRTGELDLHRTEIENPPIGIFSILPASDGTAYCSAVLGLTLSRVDPATGEAEILGLAYNGSGEIYGSAEASGKIYSVAYTHANLTVYDPSRPWQPGAEPGDNPRNLGSVGKEQYRPVTGILNGPGGKLYIGTMPAYGSKGGALTVVDPAGDTHKSYRHLVPDHAILGLACGPEQVYLGTSVIADGFIQPSEGNAYFLIFDPEGETILFQQEVEAARSLVTMGFAEGKVFFWTDDHDGGARLFVHDLAARSFRRIKHPLDAGRPHNRPMVAGPNNGLCFVHNNRIVRLDPETETLEIFHDAGPGEPPILAAYAGGLLFSKGHELWRLA